MRKRIMGRMIKETFFARIVKDYPFLKHMDIYDRQSFIREYVLDNVYVCIFMYLVFYVALWYANKAIKRIEKANKKLMKTVVGNKTKLDDVMALKDKRAEYEDIVVKAKGAQKVTAKHLDNEMKRLSSELVATGNKMTELEKILDKMLYSVSAGKSLENVAKEFVEDRKGRRLSRTRSRISRSSSRHFHQRCRLSRRHGSTVSLSRDHQVSDNSRRLHRRKSDSSNRGSAESSSNDSRRMARSHSRLSFSRYKFRNEHDENRCRSKIRSRRNSLSRNASATSLNTFFQPFKSSTNFIKIIPDRFILTNKS